MERVKRDRSHWVMHPRRTLTLEMAASNARRAARWWREDPCVEYGWELGYWVGRALWLRTRSGA